MATNILVKHETEVADAIRAKKGTTAKINPQDFAAEIASIKGKNLAIETNDFLMTDIVSYNIFGENEYGVVAYRFESGTDDTLTVEYTGGFKLATIKFTNNSPTYIIVTRLENNQTTIDGPDIDGLHRQLTQNDKVYWYLSASSPYMNVVEYRATYS